MKKVNKKKGFTLVELAIVIAVIAILAAILVPTLTTVLGKANKTKDSTTVTKAIQAYVTDNVDVVEDFEDCYVVYTDGAKTSVYHIVNASVSGDAVTVTGTSSDYINADGSAYLSAMPTTAKTVYYQKDSTHNGADKLDTKFVVYVKKTVNG